MGKNPFDEVVRLFGTLYSIPTDGLTNAEYRQKHVERIQTANKFIAEERKEIEAAKPAAEAEKNEHTKSQSKRNKARKEKRERKLQNIALEDNAS